MKVSKKRVGRPKRRPSYKRSNNPDDVILAKRYDNSSLFDIYRVSEYPEVKALVELIFSEMKAVPGLVPSQGKYSRKLYEHLRLTLLNLCIVHFSDPAKYIAIDRDKNAYRKGSRYHKLFISYTYLIKAIDYLIDNKYAEYKKGFHFKDKGFKSRIKATPKLIQLIEQEKISATMIKHNIPDDRLIILKDEDKIEIEYEDTAETLRMKENLKIINKVLGNTPILLEIWDEDLAFVNERLNDHPDPSKRKGGSIEFTKTQLHRTFNNCSWKQGGRFYGGYWQRIPRACRKYIKINDKDVVELDYSGLHINMLYAMEKLPMPKGDVYHLENYNNTDIFRDFIKQLLLIMVNSKDQDSTRQAIHKAVHREKKVKLPESEGILSTAGEYIFPLMKAFGKKHSDIKHYFNSGKGIDLQYLDSQIAEKVMVHFAKMGYAVLPLHDSFILHHGLERELEEEMSKAFYDMFQVEPKIDLKYNSITKRNEEDKDIRMAQGMSEEEAADPGVYDVPFDKRWEDQGEAGPYGTYYKHLNAHWRLKELERDAAKAAQETSQ